MQFMLVHGWAFSYALWKNSIPLAHPYQFGSWSRGYRNNESVEEIIPSMPFSVIVHSGGLYVLSEEVLIRAENILWYGGFVRKLPYIEKTVKAFPTSPDSVLDRFYERSYFPNPVPFVSSVWSYTRLKEDLLRLLVFPYETWWQDHSFVLPKLFCVWGEKDRIVSEEERTACMKSSIPYMIVPHMGHMPKKSQEWERCLVNWIEHKRSE